MTVLGKKVLAIAPVGLGTLVTVHTTRSSVRLPDLRAMGISLGAAAQHQWTLTGRSEAGVDDLLVTPLRGPTDECEAVGPARAFTTATAL